MVVVFRRTWMIEISFFPTSCRSVSSISTTGILVTFLSPPCPLYSALAVPSSSISHWALHHFLLSWPNIHSLPPFLPRISLLGFFTEKLSSLFTLFFQAGPLAFLMNCAANMNYSFFINAVCPFLPSLPYCQGYYWYFFLRIPLLYPYYVYKKKWFRSWYELNSTLYLIGRNFSFSFAPSP